MSEAKSGRQAAAREQELASLEEDQLVAAKARHLGRLRLSRRVRALMWALRIYVLAMVAVVVYVLLR